MAPNDKAEEMRRKLNVETVIREDPVDEQQPPEAAGDVEVHHPDPVILRNDISPGHHAYMAGGRVDVVVAPSTNTFSMGEIGGG